MLNGRFPISAYVDLGRQPFVLGEADEAVVGDEAVVLDEVVVVDEAV